ncbi:hypothetical protein CSUI_007340 [Cystoisospora suis]|uniref:Transmembrane protein n=1 Tax=Cystoisospora suis TaxID=483139 RepID=A0A2C6JVI1_9APIC|nr:hypothetical protein CSUI_007340 [Cystoisospora suis]
MNLHTCIYTPGVKKGLDREEEERAVSLLSIFLSIFLCLRLSSLYPVSVCLGIFRGASLLSFSFIRRNAFLKRKRDLSSEEKKAK